MSRTRSPTPPGDRPTRRSTAPRTNQPPTPANDLPPAKDLPPARRAPVGTTGPTKIPGPAKNPAPTKSPGPTKKPGLTRNPAPIEDTRPAGDLSVTGSGPAKDSRPAKNPRPAKNLRPTEDPRPAIGISVTGSGPAKDSRPAKNPAPAKDLRRTEDARPAGGASITATGPANETGGRGDARPAGSPAYRRSAGSPRGEARRRQLLDRVADDLAANGLIDFSLRRAARAAGTTHKVLLYYFDGADDLLIQAILKLRDRRIDRGLAAATRDPGRPLSARVRDLWPALVIEEGHVLDQAIGLSMYDPARFAALGQGASQQYLPALLSLLPETWTERRRIEIAELILGALRGFLIDRLTSGNSDGVDAGLDALSRALDREEAVDSM